MITAKVDVFGVGRFLVPDDTPTHRSDSEGCVHSICGRYSPDLAKELGEWGNRCGQEYSYLAKYREKRIVRTVIDIGANIGAYAVWAARYWWSDLHRIDCYEPNPQAAALAEINTGGANAGIHIHEAAVSTSEAPRFQLDERWGCSYVLGASLDQGVRRPDGLSAVVPAVHPKDLPQADAVKIDGEGCEVDVLLHYPYWDTVVVLQIEWHSHEARKLMYEVAGRAGLMLAKNDCGEDSQGVACWVRP